MNATLPGRRAKLLLCFAIVYLVWGSTYLVTAVGVRAMPPFLFGALRFVVGGALLFVVARSLRSYRSPKTRTEWHAEGRHILTVGAFAVLVSNGSNAWGLQYVPSNQGALLNASVAFWVTLFGMFGARAHQPDRLAWTGLAIGLAGTALILLPRAPTGATPPSPWGPLIPELVILLGCMGWSLGTVLQRNTRSSFDLLSFTALQQIAGGLMLLLVGIASGELTHRWQWSGEAGWALVYLAVVSSCITYTAYAWLTQHAAPSQVGTYALVNPAIATLLGWIALEERLAPTQWVGMAIILAGVLLVNWPGMTRRGGAAD